MHKKYFFFDIDGTLTDGSTHLIVPSALETLHALEKEGHFVSIATGRAHYKTVSFSEPIGIGNLVCCGGGCLVVNHKVLENQPLPAASAKEILHHAYAEKIGYLLMLNDSDEVYMKDFRFLETAGRRTELTTYILNKDMDIDALPAVYKIYLAVNDEMMQARPWTDALGWLRMEKGYVVYQHDDKKGGIIRMMHLLKAPLEDVVVFGDGKNDLVMFDKRWTSIAMGNGSPLLKEKADYVTDDNIHDGIQKACLHFGWIRGQNDVA